MSFDRASGILLVTVLTLSAAGSYTDWTIQASPPLDVGHAARTDNPHETTAAQVGAYTIAQVDQAIESAVASIVAGASEALDTLSEIETWINATNTAIANRLRFDTAQTLTAPQKALGQGNLGISTFGQSVIAAPDSPTMLRVLGARSPKNLIINPAMQVAQEWGNYLKTGHNGIYPADCFQVAQSTDCAFTVLHTAAGYGHTARAEAEIQLAITGADAVIGAGQVMALETALEADHVGFLKWGYGAGYGRPILVRMCFLVPMAGTFFVSLHNNDYSRSYVHPVTFSSGQIGNIVDVAFLVPPDDAGSWIRNGNGVGLRIRFVMACGATYQTANQDAWQSGQYFAGTNISNGVGSTVTWRFQQWGLYDAKDLLPGQVPEFEVPRFIDELRRCQRYYEHTYNYGVQRGAITEVGVQYWGVSTSGITSILVYTPGRFSAEKRVVPSMAIYSPTSGQNNYANDGNYGETITQPVAIGTTGFSLHPQTTRANAQVLRCHWCAWARL